jgi:hypothetical protein
MTALRHEASPVPERRWILTTPAVDVQDAQHEPVHEATYRFVELVFGGRYARRHFRIVEHRS